MKRRRLLVIATIGCLLLAVSFVLRQTLLRAASPGVTLENFRRLHDRMNMGEIEAILEAPSPDRSFPPFSYAWKGTEGTVQLNAITSKEREIMIGWTGTFTTPDGRTFRVAKAGDDFIVRFRRWLGW